ncbi:MAG: hypothetical protein ACOH2F_03575 [Cellulomonas sp.]
MSIGWLTSAEVRDEPYWATCDVDTDTALDKLLASARSQCEAFAPALVAGADVPEAYRLAQAFQTRGLYRSSIAGSGDGIGSDGMTVTVFPMDWTVKNLLRPKRGVPVLR